MLGDWRNGVKVYKHHVHDIYLSRLSDWWLFGAADANLFTASRHYEIGRHCPGNIREITLKGSKDVSKGVIKAQCKHAE